jgi:hypothetical protein
MRKPAYLLTTVLCTCYLIPTAVVVEANSTSSLSAQTRRYLENLQGPAGPLKGIRLR